jgi:hypothetical protein
VCKRRLILYFFSQILHMLSAEGPVDKLHAQHSSAVSLMERSLFLCRCHLFWRERDLDGEGQSESKWGGSRDPRRGGGGEREHREFTTKRREKAEPTTVPTPSSADRYRRD